MGDEGWWRFAFITFHRECERRVVISRRLGLVNIDLRQHGSAPAVPVRLAGYLPPRDAKPCQRSNLQNRRIDGNRRGERGGDVVKVIPGRTYGVIGGDHQIAQPAPALLDFTLLSNYLIEALRT